MALVMDDLTLERIQRRQAEIRPLRTLLTLVAAALFGLGYAAMFVWATTWAVLSWSLAALAEGWSTAKAARSSGAG